MEPESKYESVPQGFAYCLNEQCKHSTKCLRYLVSKQLTPERTVFSIVNPDCTTPQADSCPFFKADQKDRYALGITQLLEAGGAQAAGGEGGSVGLAAHQLLASTPT